MKLLGIMVFFIYLWLRFDRVGKQVAHGLAKDTGFWVAVAIVGGFVLVFAAMAHS